MKAILEFNLDNPDDRMAHLGAVKAADMANVLFEITHNLKHRLRSNESLSDLSNSEVLDRVFEEIAELMDSNNINLEEITE